MASPRKRLVSSPEGQYFPGRPCTGTGEIVESLVCTKGACLPQGGHPKAARNAPGNRDRPPGLQDGEAALEKKSDEVEKVRILPQRPVPSPQPQC